MKKTGEELPSFTTPHRAPVRSELSPNIYRHALIVHGAERTVERERERERERVRKVTGAGGSIYKADDGRHTGQPVIAAN
jgi:hypothetical protein